MNPYILRTLVFSLADAVADSLAPDTGQKAKLGPDDVLWGADCIRPAPVTNACNAEPKTDAAAPMAADINGISHAEYQRQRDSDRRFDRSQALGTVVNSTHLLQGLNPDQIIALADRLFWYVHLGTVEPVQVNLGSVPTEQLVAELGARVS